MGDIKQFPDLRAENRESIVAGLRLQADAIEQGVDDYDAILICGFYRETDEIEPFSLGLSNPELHWMGGQLQNWAIVDHHESLEDDD